MKTYLLFCTCFLLTALGVLGQKRATDQLSLDTLKRANPLLTKNDKKIIGTAKLPNLVSGPSFQKIFKRDFSTVVGNNNLPTNQLIVSLNKPEITLGQLFQIFSFYKSIPLISAYPYINGSLNNKDEFNLYENSQVNPNINGGGKIVFMPQAFFKGTGYFFKPDESTKMYIEKNNDLKKAIKKKYTAGGLTESRDKLIGDSLECKKDIIKYELLREYVRRKQNFSRNVLIDKIVITDNNNGQSDTISIKNIKSLSADKAIEIDSLKEVNDTIRVIFKSQASTFLTDSTLFESDADYTERLNTLREKYITINQELEEAKELLTKSQSRWKKLKREEVYEIEKDAAWTRRRFFWITGELSTSKQEVNLFRRGIIEEGLKFNKNVRGASVNYATFTEGFVLTLTAKYDYVNANTFFDNKLNTYTKDSLITNSAYRISTNLVAYDASEMSNSDIDKKKDTKVITGGLTALWGVNKKIGLNLNYQLQQETKEANLKVGLILPIIMDNAKAEQTNIILELLLPDVSTKIEKNAGQTPWNRKALNLKVGIPINLL